MVPVLNPNIPSGVFPKTSDAKTFASTPLAARQRRVASASLPPIERVLSGQPERCIYQEGTILGTRAFLL